VGSIRRRSDRQRPYLARYRGPDGKERTTAFRRKVDAQRWLVEREREKHRGEWVDPALGLVTFGEWVAETEATRLNRRKSTLARDDSVVRTLILPTLGERTLTSVEPIDIRQWVAVVSDRGYAPTTIAKAYQIVARAFRMPSPMG